MDTIFLKSDTLIVSKINRKTKAKMFENLKVGDKIEFSVPIKQAGRNSGSLYATYIKVRNIDSGEFTYSSFNQLPTILTAFEFSDETEYEEFIKNPMSSIHYKK